MAFNHIGDPYTKGYLWKYEIEQLAIYQQFLDSAKNIINEFINSEIIEFFFSHLVFDTARKIFWKNYIKKISNILIVSDRNKLIAMQSIKSNNLFEWIESRHIILNIDSPDIALIMEVNNHFIIEISSKGNACYIYSKSSPYYNKINTIINSRKIKALYELKSPNLPTLNYYSSPSTSSGRLIHHQNWQFTFQLVLKRIIGI